MKDLVHLLLPRIWFTCTKCSDVWPARGKSQSSFPVMLPPVVSSPASPSSGVGVQLMWAKAWPCHGGCPGEVNVVVGRLQLAGHGGSGVGSSVCMDRAAVVARAQLEECVSSTVLLRPWWACLEELLVLPVASAMVVGAKQRWWRSDEVRCNNTGL